MHALLEQMLSAANNDSTSCQSLHMCAAPRHHALMHQLCTTPKNMYEWMKRNDRLLQLITDHCIQWSMKMDLI